MKSEFEVYQMQVEDHLFWVARSKILKGCLGQGDTAEDAIKELEINEEEWIDTATVCGIPVPAPTVHSQYAYSGKVSLRFSPFTHEEASNNAKALNISLNQYINDAIVYYNALNKNKSQLQRELFESEGIIETSATTIVNFSEYFNKSQKYNLNQNIDNPEEM